MADPTQDFQFAVPPPSDGGIGDAFTDVSRRIVSTVTGKPYQSIEDQRQQDFLNKNAAAMGGTNTQIWGNTPPAPSKTNFIVIGGIALFVLLLFNSK